MQGFLGKYEKANDTIKEKDAKEAAAADKKAKAADTKAKDKASGQM
jgi:hypothetical protein